MCSYQLISSRIVATYKLELMLSPKVIPRPRDYLSFTVPLAQYLMLLSLISLIYIYLYICLPVFLVINLLITSIFKCPVLLFIYRASYGNTYLPI